MKVSKYEVFSYNNILGLENRINSQIRIGWQPLGGVQVSISNDGGSWYTQSVVRYTD